MDDKEAHDILSDKVDYKLCLAKYYLSKIDTNVPLNYDKEHFTLESNIESFLWYANLAIENFTFSINKHFLDVVPKSKYRTLTLTQSDYLIKEIDFTSDDGTWYDKLSIHNLKKSLDKSNSNQKIVRKIIEDYFSKPKEIDNQYDFTRSSLFVLRELRNYVAHNPILNRHGVRGATNYTLFLFRINIKNYQKAQPKKDQSEKIGIKLGMVEQNPHDYFQQLFDALIDFIDDICKIIPEIYPSSHYKTLPNSELQELLDTRPLK